MKKARKTPSLFVLRQQRYQSRHPLEKRFLEAPVLALLASPIVDGVAVEIDYYIKVINNCKYL